ncbi:MAG TPA: metallophosphoesterase [Candidatus Acidoferrales bacterium]|nr:metallophosphoesterase [Candidatus Acidoferrales bacterium]
MKRRWRHGGVETYSLGQSSGISQLKRLALRARIELTEHHIRLAGLGEPFRGLRIVQLTDIHHGIYFPEAALNLVVEMTNKLNPDIVALTGDFVTRSRNYIEPCAEILSGLQATEGVFAVLGNHDFRVGADPIASALDRNGIEVLRNRHVTLRRRGQKLCLAGIDDFLYRADLPRALRGISENTPTVLLSHNPAIIEGASRMGVGLVLSGHTHGGQVRLPLVGCVYGRSDEKMRFKKGRDSLRGTQIYVSRGLGTVVLPIRYGCPPELPHFVLEPRERSSKPRVSSIDGWLPARPHARR